MGIINFRIDNLPFWHLFNTLLLLNIFLGGLGTLKIVGIAVGFNFFEPSFR